MDVRERKEALKRRFPGIVRGIRALSRFRFLFKARQVRREGVGLRDDPLSVFRFVLFDPETHSYTYELANADELGPFLERASGVPAEEIARYVAEVRNDPELGKRLRRRVRWRIDYKRRMPLGNRLLWYALVRAVKPRLIVETGIHQGLGSLVLLRALDRNAAEGVDGRLISIDFDAASGWLVPDHLRARWTPVFGDIESSLESVLAGREVDLFIHESDHNEALQRIEFGAALAHSADELYVVDSSGVELPVLSELCGLYGGERNLFHERPKRHFYRPVGTAVAKFTNAAARGPKPATGRFKPAADARPPARAGVERPEPVGSPES
jgi:Methyltransferase domain